mmetsp:Transcript_10870/g.18015  ORF Transcript_10870/g.18015 Transcript_10870/m.18015 type:complete len:449 (-) Transcript_10870:54-1400(-)
MNLKGTLPSTLLITAAAAIVGAATAEKDWVSLSPNTQFRLADTDATNEKGRRLRAAQDRFLQEETETEAPFTSEAAVFVDSQETYYDGYQQAWRMLGFVVDCEKSADNRRSLNEGDEDVACTRYLLWAAYVDLDYQGGGIGEYQFWDEVAEEWDESTCEINGNGRCAKMDCHDPNTHFEALGFFKEAYYGSEWFEQLFKHSGYCLWDEDTYEFMSENYDNWPEGCSGTEYSTAEGETIYIDIKPTASANMTFGVYTDSKCSIEYMDSDVYADEIIASEGYLSGADLDTWNTGLDVYKYCHPCPASDRRSGNNNDNNRRRLEDDPNGGYFQCDDDAGYTNVNQCMKFSSKTTMESAGYRELKEAEKQGGLLQVSVGGQLLGMPVSSPSTAYAVQVAFAEKQSQTEAYLNASLYTFAGSLALLLLVLVWKKIRANARHVNPSLSQPLVSQ